jgi:Tat protein secretion system quality control protein TatD with DNase activity
MQQTPLENLFLETDMSEKTIEEIYQIAVQVTGRDLETIINSITNNYNRLFQL